MPNQASVEPAASGTEDDPQFRQQRVVGGDLSGRRLTAFTSVGSRFERCRFERCRVQTASFGAGTEVSEFVDCSFDGIRIARTLGGFARFERCTFKDVDLRNWDGEYVELVECVFTGRLRSVQIWGMPLRSGAEARYEAHVRWLASEGMGAPPSGLRTLMLREHNEVRDNDFSGSELVDVSFRGGVDLSRQRLPAGPDYLYLPTAEESLARALERVDDEVEEALRARVRRFLADVLGREVAQGQRQLLVREKDFSSRGAVKPHVAAAVGLLRGTA